MKKVFTLVVLIAVLLGFTSLQGLNQEEADQTILAIYQQNLASVSEVRLLEVEKGTQEVKIEDIPRRIMPTSLQIKTLEGPGQLSVLEQSYHFKPVTQENLLASFVGKQIEVIAQGSMGYKTYKGILLGTSGGIILKDQSGKVELIKDPVELSFPGLPEDFAPEPYLLWKIADGEKEGAYKIRINYLTEGLDWNAYYSIVLTGPQRSDLTSWISVANQGGKTFQNALLELVAGELHRAESNRGTAFLKAMAPEAEAGFESQRLFEYHRYSLNRKVSLKDGEQRQLSFITASGVKVEKVYTYQGQVEDGVQVSLNFTNSESNGLGKPLPAGTVKFYQQDEDGLRFIGEDRISHTPTDEKVNLTLGAAFDIVGERKRTDYQKVDEETYIESYQITLRSHKEEEVTVKVIENLRGSWEILHSYPTFEKLDAQRIGFTVEVEPDEESTIRYTVRYKL